MVHVAIGGEKAREGAFPEQSGCAFPPPLNLNQQMGKRRPALKAEGRNSRRKQGKENKAESYGGEMGGQDREHTVQPGSRRDRDICCRSLSKLFPFPLSQGQLTSRCNPKMLTPIPGGIARGGWSVSEGASAQQARSPFGTILYGAVFYSEGERTLWTQW